MLIAVAAVLVPVITAAARAIVVTDWLPIGDNAFFAIRAIDVFSAEHRPLLGTWTSASQSVGTDLNNPGPLLFDWLAVPSFLAPRGDGVVIAVALLNLASLVGIALFAHRRGGALLATLATAISALLCWSMGSELLFDPWQPHALLLPFLCLLVLAWSISCGDLTALPWAVGVASFVLQTHLTYSIIIPALGLWAAVGLTLELRARRRADPEAWPALRRRLLRLSGVSVVVFGVLWAQSFVEQFTSEGDGNLTRLVESASQTGDTLGLSVAARLVSEVVALPPTWVRPSFGNAFGGTDSGLDKLPGLGLALVSLALLGTFVFVVAWIARRARDRVAFRALVTALVALGAATLTAAQAPTTAFGVAPHQFRWLWPIAAFGTFAVAAVVVRRLADTAVSAPMLVGAATAVTVLVAAANVPAHNVGTGPAVDDYAIGVMRDLNRQFDALEGEGPLLADLHGERFADPYGAAIMAELQRRDVPFLVDDPGMVRQLGPVREFEGEAEARIFHETGDAALTTPPGTRRVAFHEGLAGDEEDELARLREELADQVGDDGLDLTDEGRADVDDGQFPLVADHLHGRVAAETLVRFGELAELVRRDLLVIDDEWASTYERWSTLEFRRARQTVAVYLEPL
ncbi:hypothetical protein BH24ACT3_BH24ACT3_15770 [soil metagenome]